MIRARPAVSGPAQTRQLGVTQPLRDGISLLGGDVPDESLGNFSDRHPTTRRINNSEPRHCSMMNMPQSAGVVRGQGYGTLGDDLSLAAGGAFPLSEGGWGARSGVRGGRSPDRGAGAAMEGGVLLDEVEFGVGGEVADAEARR